MIQLAPADISGMDAFANPNDVRRDLHVYIGYAGSHEVKRHFRSNSIAKTDVKKMAALFTDPSGFAASESNGMLWPWLEYIDELARLAGFVSYDTKGVYRGYSSSEPTFVDNYVKLNEEAWATFLALSPQEQEQRLLGCLLDYFRHDKNEFLAGPPLGRLDKFSYQGCATGVMPSIRFDKARQTLLTALRDVPPGAWFSTESLIQYVRSQDPWFLIPRLHGSNRYGNFREGASRWGADTAIKADTPGAFNRVEGRYIERFLETIPLNMGYVDCAYLPAGDQNVYPSIGRLAAFRTTQRFFRYMHGGYSRPRVTVLPDFEIQVQPDVYPGSVIERLAGLATIEKIDTTCIFKIDKSRVMQTAAAHPDTDIIEILRRLTKGDIPANVLRELEGWQERSDVFLLYDNCLLLEIDGECKEIDELTIDKISDRFRIMATGETFLDRLRKQAWTPIEIRHGEQAFAVLPPEAKTRFPKKSFRQSANRMPSLKIERSTFVKLRIVEEEYFNEVLLEFASAGCNIAIDKTKRLLTYHEGLQPAVDKVLKSLRARFDMRVGQAAGNIT